jgi:DNA-binding transcriptional MerR regulator
MRISELSAKTQVSVHRLRRYEAAGFIASQRSPNGYRDYDEKTVRHVVFIAMSRAMGFSLPFIAEQKTLRKKLIDHIGWFETKQRKSR